MIEVKRTKVFVAWLDGLRDLRARARIAARINRVKGNNLGDFRPVGEGVSELRIDYGPGYRLYFTRRGKAVVFLLCGGDKSTQASDIKRAIAMAKEI